MRNKMMQFWNLTVLILGGIASVGLPWFLESLQPSITSDVAWLIFPALIAAVAYWLMRGSTQVRIRWLVALAFIPIAVFLIPVMPSVFDSWKSFLAITLWILWLLSYFAAVALCATLNAGIRRCRSRYLA